MIDFLDLIDEFGEVRGQERRVVIVQEVEIDSVFPAEEEGGSESSSAPIDTISVPSIALREGKTHESRKSRTTRRTRGRGQMISRLPRGIWRTRLVELGATVTILDPLSTARLIEGVSLSPPAPPPVARRANDSECSSVVGPV